MTKTQRRQVYELGAISAAGLFGAFAVPTLISERNSIAALCGFLLLVGWLVWTAYFIFRATSERA